MKKVVLKIKNVYTTETTVGNDNITGNIVNIAYIDGYVYRINDNRFGCIVPAGKPYATFRQITDYLPQVLLEKTTFNKINDGDTKLIFSATKEVFNYLIHGEEKKEIFVDGYTSGNPGPGGFNVTDRNKNVIHRAYYDEPHSNNVYETLGLLWCIEQFKDVDDIVIYTDSVTALAWVKGKIGKEVAKKYQDDPIFNEILARAIVLDNEWIDEHVKKWDTEKDGNIPADMGRK